MAYYYISDSGVLYKEISANLLLNVDTGETLNRFSVGGLTGIGYMVIGTTFQIG